MAKLTDFKLLSFDVYGTLIDWERGCLTAFEPALTDSGKSFSDTNLDQKHILQVMHVIQKDIQAEHPQMKYSELLAAVHPKLCAELGLKTPTKEASERFGGSVGEWPGWPDSVEALQRLSKTYKMVVLSNVDNASFKVSNANGLGGFKFDAVYTAEDIGSYKPSLNNFEYMLKHAKDDFGVEKHQVLQTAQSQFHDHHPAKEIGIKSSWIYRPGAVMGNRDDPVYTWKFDTLADMADAVDKELAEQRK